MIEFNKFKESIRKAEQVFGYLGEDQRKTYWENVKGFPEETVLCAIDKLIATHGFYKFPTVAEFMDAISDQFHIQVTRPWEPSCERCNGVGRFVSEYWETDGTYYKEVFCDCDAGRKQQELRLAYFERRRRGLTSEPGSTI